MYGVFIYALKQFRVCIKLSVFSKSLAFMSFCSFVTIKSFSVSSLQLFSHHAVYLIFVLCFYCLAELYPIVLKQFFSYLLAVSLQYRYSSHYTRSRTCFWKPCLNHHSGLCSRLQSFKNPLKPSQIIHSVFTVCTNLVLYKLLCKSFRL